MAYQLLYFVLVLSSGFSYAAQMHVCTDAAGNKSFQQMPCQNSAKAEVKNLEPAAMVGTVSPGSDQFYENARQFNTQEQLKREIRKSENKLKQYQAAMQNELAILKNKKRAANNNLAGAQWESSISTEMQAVTTKYNSLMTTEQAHLERYRQQLKRL